MFQTEIEVATKGRGTYELTARVADAVRAAKVATGLCHVFTTHTSASLIVCENADPEVRAEHPLSELDRARYKQVRVTEYDDGSGPVPISPTEVQQTVRLSVVNIHTQAERTIIDRQTWHYDEKAKHWWLTSGLPDITRE